MAVTLGVLESYWRVTGMMITHMYGLPLAFTFFLFVGFYHRFRAWSIHGPMKVNGFRVNEFTSNNSPLDRQGLSRGLYFLSVPCESWPSLVFSVHYLSLSGWSVFHSHMSWRGVSEGSRRFNDYVSISCILLISFLFLGIIVIASIYVLTPLLLILLIVWFLCASIIFSTNFSYSCIFLMLCLNPT